MRAFSILLIVLGLQFVPVRLARAANACTDADFVKRAYADALYRSPTSSELNAILSGGLIGTRTELAFGVLSSDEYRLDLIGANVSVVQGYFQLLLGRNPAGFGEAAAVAAATVGASDEQVAALIIGSAEYAARAIALNPAICDDAGKIVDQIAIDLLGRHATSQELAQFSPNIANAQQRQTVALAMTSSTEYVSSIVRHGYVRFLHRLPTPSEAQFFSQAIQQGGTDEDVYALLMGSDEYCSGNPGALPIFSIPTAAAILNDVQIVFPPDAGRLPPIRVTPIEAAASATVLTLQARVAADDDTILSLVNEAFGLVVDANAATAARDVARTTLDAALAAAGPLDPQVRLAQTKFAAGALALDASNFEAALRNFRNAFAAAQRAVR
jgi:hypothetical protein